MNIRKGRYIMSEITIGELFAGWVDSLGESAQSNYSNNIKEFFQMMFGKDVSEVTEQDLSSIRPHDVRVKYINVLTNDCKNSTGCSSASTCSSCNCRGYESFRNFR